MAYAAELAANVRNVSTEHSGCPPTMKRKLSLPLSQLHLLRIVPKSQRLITQHVHEPLTLSHYRAKCYYSCQGGISCSQSSSKEGEALTFLRHTQNSEP